MSGSLQSGSAASAVNSASASRHFFVRPGHSAVHHTADLATTRALHLRMGNTPNTNIPTDVAQMIIRDLDLGTIRSLARVNSSWQEAVEPLLWQKASLKVEDCPSVKRWVEHLDEEDGTSVERWILRKMHQLESALASQPDNKRYIDALRLLRTASTASPYAMMAFVQTLISRFDLFVDVESETSVEEWILHKTCLLRSALATRQVRARYIKELRLVATGSTAPIITAILRRTPFLQSLFIGPPQIDGESEQFHLRCQHSTSTLLKFFIDLPPFEVLAALNIRVTEDQWSQFWHSLPRVAPNLVRLDVDLFVPIAPPTTPEARSIALPASVDTLSVTTTPETFGNVVALIHLDPTLKRIHLRGRQLDRCPLNQQAITTLSTCKIKRLELSFDKQATNKVWHDMLRQPGAFKNVEKLIVGFPDDWNPWVPPLPNLQTLVYTHMEWPEFDGYGYTTSIVDPDERKEIYAIVEDCAADILRAPRLGTLVKLGEWFEDIDYTALAHEHWLRHCVRIRLFRSYHRGDDVLLHMRELEWKKTVFASKADLPHICRGEGCDEHYWTHATCYNGFGVDGETLEAVYVAMEQELDWLTPKRGLELPQAAWQVLHEWWHRQ